VSIPLLSQGQPYQTQRIADFFKNAHDFEIYGGQFTLVNSSVDSEALNSIRQDVRHIKIIVVVLFVSAGHLRTLNILMEQN
jgi:hypothetical protein